jgi:hypothetical protein
MELNTKIYIYFVATLVFLSAVIYQMYNGNWITAILLCVPTYYMAYWEFILCMQHPEVVKLILKGISAKLFSKKPKEELKKID